MSSNKKAGVVPPAINYFYATAGDCFNCSRDSNYLQVPAGAGETIMRLVRYGSSSFSLAGGTLDDLVAWLRGQGWHHRATTAPVEYARLVRNCAGAMATITLYHSQTVLVQGAPHAAACGRAALQSLVGSEVAE